MIEKLLSYGTMIGMAFGVLFWAQSNFVDAMDFRQYQYENIEDEVNYLRDKKLRLENEFQQLDFEDSRQLERLEMKLKRIQQDLGK